MTTGAFRGIVLGGDAALEAAVGKAIHRYSKVEIAQADFIGTVLKLKTIPASIIFHSVQNVRTRNEMIQEFLRFAYGEEFSAFWAKCSAFLFKLSVYRNAIVHWHPVTNFSYTTATNETRVAPAIKNPNYGKRHSTLEIDDFKLFVEDCVYIQNELGDFRRYLKNKTEPLPEKYLRPAIRPNLAVLQQPQTPKAPQPQRPPSRGLARKGPTPSAKQRRNRALAEAARKKK